jgi:hypothetical protein
MMENEFRRIALAQGLLPAMPPPVLETASGSEPDNSPASGGPEDNPAMAEQHAPSA